RRARMPMRPGRRWRRRARLARRRIASAAGSTRFALTTEIMTRPTSRPMLAISAWIAAKEGARDQAVRFMRAAADGEDGSIKNVIMENRLYPLREMLAELLLEVRPARGRVEGIRGRTQADAQPLPRFLGCRTRGRCDGQPNAGL